MSIKTRLVKLEAFASNKPVTFRIARFIVAPGNIDPIGYQCGDIKIMRGLGETPNALQKRCFDSVTWPDGNCRNIFEPLEVSWSH